MYHYLLMLFPFCCFAQTDSMLIKEIHVLEGDTFITAELENIDILSFKTAEDKRYYYRLKRKTLKVYPYALLAAHKLDSIQRFRADSKKKETQKIYKSSGILGERRFGRRDEKTHTMGRAYFSETDLPRNWYLHIRYCKRSKGWVACLFMAASSQNL